MRQRYFFIVDKAYGASHSFVDGMLNKILLKKDENSIIYYGKSDLSPGLLDFSKKSIVESYFKRVGLQKIFFSFSSLIYYIKEYGGGEGNKVFIRNELFCLFFFSAFKFIFKKNFNLYFQSSFPHEEFSGGLVKCSVAKFILKISLRNVDRIFVVSPLAIKRLKKYKLKSNVEFVTIPLCSDFPVKRIPPTINELSIKLLYIGSFSKSRQLDVILESLDLAMKNNGFSNITLTLIGGSHTEYLLEYPSSRELVEKLIDRKVICFPGKFSRDFLLREIHNYDIGINLIPPEEMYLESSSTKLGEYLSQGLPVLSNSEIKYHSYIHSINDIGWLCSFNKIDISIHIAELSKIGGSDYLNKSKNATLVAEDKLNYIHYEKYFLG